MTTRAVRRLGLLRDEVSTDTSFQMTGSTVRFGSGAPREVGAEFVDLRCRRVLVFVDPAVRDLYPGEAALESLRSAGLSFDVFSDIRCEPADSSFREAIAASSSSAFDGFLAVGGGSTIDTAKAANLHARWPADFTEYVNPTLGRGATPPGPLKPLIAVPTTAGTGSETTAVAVFDTEADIPRLVEGTVVQARLLKLSPIAPTADLLTQLFHESLDVGERQLPAGERLRAAPATVGNR